MKRKSGREDLPLFFFLLFVFGYFYQGGFDNQNSRFDLALAMAFERRPAIDTFHLNTIDKVPFGTHFYSEKAPGVAYFALPVPWIASFFVDVRTLLSRPGLADALLYLSTVMTVSLLSAISAVFFRRFVALLNPKLGHSATLLVTLVTYLGTLILPYSTVLFSHQLAGSLLLAATYFGFCRRYALGAFAYGIAVFVEYTCAVPAVFLAAFFWWSNVERRKLWRYLPFAAIPGVALLLHNALCFGNLLSLGNGQLGATQFAGEMTRGFFGITVPAVDRLLHLTVGPYRGLFFYSPILLLTLTAVPEAYRRQKTLTLGILLSLVAMVVLNASYGYWQGGVCFGPRHLVPMIPIFALLFAFVPPGWWRSPVTLGISVLSVAIALVGTATTLFVSEYDTNPLWHSYRALVLQGAVSVNPNSVLTPSAEARARWATPEKFSGVAWNWGERIGLQGWWSLLPLLSVTIGFVFVICVTRRPVSSHREMPRAE